jgi:putative transposase
MWSWHLAQGWQPTLPDPDELDMLFRPQIPVKTNRGLVRVLGNSYHNKDLEHYHGQHVHVGFDIHDASHVWVRDQDERLICIAKFEGNKRDFYPVPVVEQALEQRRKRRHKTAMNRVDEIEAEAEGTRKQLAPEAIGITPEQIESCARVLQLVQKRKERKIVGSVWERYEDICDRAKSGDLSDYERQWKIDYEAFSSTGKKTGLYREDEYCTGEFDEERDKEKEA